MRLLRRFALVASNIPANVAASANAQRVFGPNILLPKIDSTQALRLIRGMASIDDDNQTHFLTMLGAGLGLFLGSTSTGVIGIPLRNWQPNSAPIVLGAFGARWSFVDDEFILGTDYVDLSVAGMVPGLFAVNVSADFSNSDPVIHAVNFSILLLVEMYQLTIGTDGAVKDFGYGGPTDWVRRPGT